MSWPRPRRSSRRHKSDRLVIACSVVGAVRILSAATFCAAGVLGLTGEDFIMTIPLETEAQILRYHHVEKWPVGTIASQLHVHHETVTRVLAQAGVVRPGPLQRRSKVDPYLPFIRDTLAAFPTLTSSRLLGMVRERGYRGGSSHFRHIIACLRPRKPAEAYLRLRTLPGDQAQIDWGHFGHVAIGRAKRPLMAFVAVLSFSRQIFLRFFLDARMENFLRGHLGAFGAWQGVPRVLLYDNLRSAVLERRGDAIRFNPALLDFAAYHRFEPRPVAVARGNEKGRVERAIRFVRSSFFAARKFADLDDLNAQADAWCNGVAADRRCPGTESGTVRDALADDRAHLLKLPDNPYPVVERIVVSVGKTPYVRFDQNDYSVPHTQVRKTLTVLAEPDALRIVDGQEVLACHQRSYAKGERIEDPSHIQALVDQKREARSHRATDHLGVTAPASQTLLVRAAERGDNLGTITASLMRLLHRYGAAELQAAIVEALERGVPHPNAVRLALEHRREARRKPPPVTLILPDHVRNRDTAVRTHSLATYDLLTGAADVEP